MKLATFTTRGRASYGIVKDAGIPGIPGIPGIIDAGARLSGTFSDLHAVLLGGGLDQVQGLAKADPDLDLADVQLLKPITNPGKILCVGVNYLGRNAEYKDASDLPKYPSLFVRFPSSFVGHGQGLVRPLESSQLDYEGEIAIVIGLGGRRIAQEDAMAHVAGFTACNEGTIRDWTKHGKFNVTAGKNFDATGAMGPYLVTPDEVPDGPMRVVTRVNGEVRQDETTDRMMFPMPLIVSYVSTFTTLEPGDIIVTGTPTGAGIRFDPPRFLVEGDVVEIEVPHVGILSNTVVNE